LFKAGPGAYTPGWYSGSTPSPFLRHIRLQLEDENQGNRLFDKIEFRVCNKKYMSRAWPFSFLTT
jgi:hypothetical protein